MSRQVACSSPTCCHRHPGTRPLTEPCRSVSASPGNTPRSEHAASQSARTLALAKLGCTRLHYRCRVHLLAQSPHCIYEKNESGCWRVGFFSLSIIALNISVAPFLQVFLYMSPNHSVTNSYCYVLSLPILLSSWFFSPLFLQVDVCVCACVWCLGIICLPP